MAGLAPLNFDFLWPALRHRRNHLSLLICHAPLCAFASLADVAKRGDGAKSALLEIVFACIRGFCFASFAPFRGYSSFPLPFAALRLCVRFFFVFIRGLPRRRLCEAGSIRGPFSRSLRSFDAVNAYLATIVKLGQQDPSVMDDD
jgi:hypothetical protein